jgi:hypothetical protein
VKIEPAIPPGALSAGMLARLPLAILASFSGFTVPWQRGGTSCQALSSQASVTPPGGTAISIILARLDRLSSRLVRARSLAKLI